MSTVVYLREFVNERLTAAAEEIFGVFKSTIVEYEEEINRQRRLLDIVWKPEIKLHRIELPQQHVCAEDEVLTDQQLCIQERNSSLDQEDPEPPQIKEEQEELCTSQEGEQLVLKQETFMLTPTDEESDHSEPERKGDHQLLSHNSHVAESQDQKGGEHGDSGSTRDAEPEPKKRHHENGDSHSNNGYRSNMSEIHCNGHTGQKSFKCDICEKDFKHWSTLDNHLRIHTGDKLYTCKRCGKAFIWSSDLIAHMRTHSVEKPYLCKTCRKSFCYISALKKHMTVHTGEKPYTCKTCGKEFRLNGDLKIHMRIHTGEKPYTCKTCGRAFRHSSHLAVHMRRAHTGEKPYLCNTCGKRFFQGCDLTRHTKSHAGK